VTAERLLRENPAVVQRALQLVCSDPAALIMAAR
jgi:hypothetical protein